MKTELDKKEHLELKTVAKTQFSTERLGSDQVKESKAESGIPESVTGTRPPPELKKNTPSVWKDHGGLSRTKDE